MGTKTKETQLVGVNLALPSEFHGRVKSNAALAGKTLHAYIVGLIESEVGMLYPDEQSATKKRRAS